MSDASLTAILEWMDIVVLERVDEDSFRFLGAIPQWFRDLYPDVHEGMTGFMPQAKLHFLENFLIDAKEFWATHASGRLKSGPWCETEILGNEWYLEASALRVGGQEIFLIELPGLVFDETQQLIQTGRDQSLSMAVEKRETRILRQAKEALEQRVHERTAELEMTNQRLERELAERKRAEEALRKTEQQMRLLAHGVSSTTEMITVTDLQDHFTFVNRSFLEQYGYSNSEVIGNHVKILWSPSNPPELAKEILEQTRLGGWKGELFNLRKDGSEFPIFLSTALIKDDEGQLVGLLGLSSDITERKEAEQALRRSEEQLRQSQKMEAIGLLAGGVAHDFNNLLTAVMGYSELLLTRINPADPMRQEVEEIKRAGERAAALTQRLLAFSRKQILAPKILDLNVEVANVEKLLCRLIGEDVRLVTRMAPGLRRVKADPGQIEQVILNLAVNARDAMPNGGILTIETENVELDENYARSHVNVTPGRYVMLAVSDSGCGMDKETQARIFEPFFTTKGEGKGTGLGLSTVYGIVAQSGGHIWFYSELGHGTTFKIYLPQTSEASSIESDKAAPGPKGGSGVILLVEDDDMVRELAGKILEVGGYTVLAARNGEEAMKISEQFEGRIRLMVTDTIMPGMNGRELARCQKEQRPNMKVLFMSGYADDAIVRSGVLDEGTTFLQKPFTPATMIRKVSEMLET